MTEKAIKDMAASVRAKLLGLARKTGKPYNKEDPYVFETCGPGLSGKPTLRIDLDRWRPLAA